MNYWNVYQYYWSDTDDQLPFFRMSRRFSIRITDLSTKIPDSDSGMHVMENDPINLFTSHLKPKVYGKSPKIQNN